MDEKTLAVETLKLHIIAGECLQKLSVNNINFIVWRQKTLTNLQKLFGSKSSQTQRFLDIIYSQNKKKDVRFALSDEELFRSGLKQAIEILEECRSNLQEGVTEIQNDKCTIIKNYLLATSPSDKKQEDGLKRIEDLRRAFTQEKKDKIAEEIINNQLATFINSIVIEIEEENKNGRYILQPASTK